MEMFEKTTEGYQQKVGKEDWKPSQVTCSSGVKTHIYHTSRYLAFCVRQVKHLCLDNRAVIEAQYQTCLRSLPCFSKDQSRVVNYTCANPWNTAESSRLGDPPAWTELCSVFIPTCVSLPRCCFRARLVGQVMRINLLLNFICGFVVVPVSCLCQLTQKIKTRFVFISNHNTTWVGSSCSSAFHGWADCWYILKPPLFS